MCILRQPGQDTVDDLRNRDFRKELEEREHQAARERSKEKRGSVEQAKRPRLDQPPANLDADDPVDDDDDDDDSDERYECYIYKYKTMYFSTWFLSQDNNTCGVPKTNIFIATHD